MTRFTRGIGLLFVLTCRDGTAPPPVARLVLLAPDSAGVVGRTLTLYAVPYDAQGVSIPGVPIAWQSLDPVRGQVDSSGHARLGPASGDVLITATAPTGAADTLSVHVAREGELRWTFAISGVTSDLGGPGLGLDGSVYVLGVPFPGQTFDGDLYALTPRGTLRWSRRLSGTNSSTLLVGPDGTVYVPGKTVWSLTPQGGTRWSQSTTATFSAALAGAIGHGSPLVVTVETLLALDPVTGDTVWVGPDPQSGGWLVPPTIAGDSVWAKLSGDSVYRISLSTGVQLSPAFRDPEDTSGDPRTFGTGPVPVGGRVYVPLWSRLAAYDLQGQVLWLTSRLGRGVGEPVVDAAGNLYAQRTGYGLVAWNPATGAERWRAPAPQSRWAWYGGPALGESGVIYAAGDDGFYAYDTSGALRWDFHTQEGSTALVPFVGAPAIAPDGTVYAYTEHFVYAFWASHPPEPNSPWPMWRHDARRSGVAR